MWYPRKEAKSVTTRSFELHRLDELTDRMAEITAAFRMLRDPDELERFRRLQRQRARGRTSRTEPGRDGVHFTAHGPGGTGGIEPAPGDPDFDYRKRAPSEFNVGPTDLGRLPRRARKPKRRRQR
jgi:hypothetical protein